MTNYRSIGMLVASFGFRGEMILRHDLGKKSALKDLPSIFIELRKDKLIPYFIESAQPRSDSEILIKFEGIDTKEQAAALSRKTVYLTEADFEKHAAASAPISFLGYSIVEADKTLGEIAEIIEQPHQLLCKIFIDGKVVLIPLHEQTLINIDQKKKLIYVELPEGLIDIFLNN